MSDLATFFVKLFPSSPTSFTQGRPLGTFKQTTDGRRKEEYFYTNAHRPFNEIDVKLHLEGKVSIVANPNRLDGCLWGAIDIDDYSKPELRIPADLRPHLNVYRSKSDGWHLFVFFKYPVRGCKVRALLRDWASRIGYPRAEVFPKQDELKEGAHGSFINLPFFGKPFTPPTFCELPESEWPLPPPDVSSPVEDVEPGYWSEAAMLAMLEAYKEMVPGFDFGPSSIGGYAVPCPGNPLLGGWEDGSQHSVEEPLLNANTHVFIKNAWPKFVCFHDHCGGHTDGMSAYEKRTINDWRKFFDPDFILFDIDSWLDDQALETS
jgi:hypothetical protein